MPNCFGWLLLRLLLLVGVFDAVRVSLMLLVVVLFCLLLFAVVVCICLAVSFSLYLLRACLFVCVFGCCVSPNVGEFVWLVARVCLLNCEFKWLLIVFFVCSIDLAYFGMCVCGFVWLCCLLVWLVWLVCLCCWCVYFVKRCCLFVVLRVCCHCVFVGARLFVRACGCVFVCVFVLFVWLGCFVWACLRACVSLRGVCFVWLFCLFVCISVLSVC